MDPGMYEWDPAAFLQVDIPEVVDELVSLLWERVTSGFDIQIKINVLVKTSASDSPTESGLAKLRIAASV